MTSKKQSEKSSAAQEEQITDSVYDFLYHDGRRIASFLAQFEPSGSLTQITEAQHTERARVDSQKIDASAGLGRLVRGGVTSNDEVRSRQQQDIMRVYDPTWANARHFLDVVDQAGLIHRDLATAHVGQIVLYSGQLSVRNLQLLTSIWSVPAGKKLMEDGLKQAQIPPLPKGHRNNPTLRQAHAAAVVEAKTMKTGFELFYQLLPTFPHTVQATISSNSDVWCSLAPEGLTLDPSDISLKFSDVIPGEWAVIGILDALPDQPPQSQAGGIDMANGGAVSNLDRVISPMARTFLGRPYGAYGITPLLVFREIGVR